MYSSFDNDTSLSLRERSTELKNRHASLAHTYSVKVGYAAEINHTLKASLPKEENLEVKKDEDKPLEQPVVEEVKEEKAVQEPVEKKKEDSKNKIVLEKHDTKSWFKSAVLGVFIGLAVIVPGISGATISIIFKLYDKLVFAISSLLKHFKKSFIWLLPIIIGIVVGVIVGFFGVSVALDYVPFAIVCLFAGLMIGALPAVFNEIKGAKKTPWRLFLLFVGFALPIVASTCITLFANEGGTPLATIEWWEFIAMFFVGAVVALTQIVPGLSASSFLMMIGYFTALVDSISLTYWKSNPAIFGIYAVLIVGFIVGLLAFSKGLSTLFEKKRETTFFPIVGLSLGSIVTMFYNPEINETYLRWQGQGASDTAVSMGLDLGLGAGLLVVGIVVSLLLVLFEIRRDKKEKLSLKA